MVRYARRDSVRYRKVGKVLKTDLEYHVDYILVEFLYPPAKGNVKEWRCHRRALQPATEKQIIMAIAEAALGMWD